MGEPYEDWDDYCDRLDAECPECKDHEQSMEIAQDAMKKIIAQLYGKEQLNCIKLHNELEILCDLVGLKNEFYPQHWPTVKRVGDLPEVHQVPKNM